MELFIKFIEENYVESKGNDILFSSIYEKYEYWLMKYDKLKLKEILKKKGFYRALRNLKYLNCREVRINNISHLRGLICKSALNNKFPEKSKIPIFKEKERLPIVEHKDESYSSSNNEYVEKSEEDKYKDFLIIDNAENNQLLPNYSRFQFNNKEEYKEFVISEYNRIQKEKYEQFIINEYNNIKI